MSGSRLAAGAALAALLAVAGAELAWNVWSQPALWGYDEVPHAAYALAILEEGRLPHPHAGWSTFHPPLYYVLAAGLWAALEPFGPRAVLAGLRAPGVLALLAATAVAFALVLRAGHGLAVAWSASALVAFLPAAQLSATMAGNEALAAGLAALALPWLLALQRDPRSPRAALVGGLFAGLAAATKFSGMWVACVGLVPFARGDLGRGGRRALACYLAALALVAGPFYARNVALAGTPFPMTRDHGPMQQSEAGMVLRERSAWDYVTMPLDCFRRPLVVFLDARGSWQGLNPAFSSVPCSLYASSWFDAFRTRIPPRWPLRAESWGTLLLLLGLAPTLLALGGLAAELRDAVATRGRAPGAPIAAMLLLGLASYAAFTWAAPSHAAGKAAYLLPLVVPAALCHARACAALPPRLRGTALALSLAAAAVAALTFRTGWPFPPQPPGPSREFWTWAARELPNARLDEVLRRLMP